MKRNMKRLNRLYDRTKANVSNHYKGYNGVNQLKPYQNQHRKQHRPHNGLRSTRR